MGFAARPSAPPSLEPQGSPENGIQVTGLLSRPSVAVGETVRFWLTLKNRAPYSIFQVRVRQLDAPGFGTADRCLCGDKSKACWDDGKSQSRSPATSIQAPMTNDCDLIAPEVKPGQVITVWGDLSAAEAHESSNLTAVVGWQTGTEEKIESQFALDLGRCAVTDRYTRVLTAVTDWFGRIWTGAWAFFKDITLPIVLLILGWRFKVWDDKREQDRRESEKQRDIDRDNREQKSAKMAEQWSIMLPDSRKLSRMYYLPLLSAVQQATSCLEKVVKDYGELGKQQDPAAKRELQKRLDGTMETAFFYWVLSWRQFRNVADSVGGLHFKDRVGEKLTAWSQGKFLQLYLGDNRDLLRTYARILDHIGIHEKLDSFLNKFREDMDPETWESLGFREGWNHFKVWVRGPKCVESISYLKGFAALVEYEANRPFEYWYGGVKERLNIDAELEKVLENLAAEIAKDQPALVGFPEKVKKYLSDGKAPG